MDLPQPYVPFEDLDIDLPDYRRADGRKASQPFSTGKHDLWRPETLRSQGSGDGERTDYFKRQLVLLRIALGKPVPYRLRDTLRKERSMDGGCLKFVGPDGQDVAEFITENGYIVAVDPKPALLAAYAEPARLAEHSRNNGEPNLRETTRQQLIQARVGQGVFRTKVLARWNDRCALTGCNLKPVIRASHIVPWGKCDTDNERLDPENGLPLLATVDALFDSGLISFDDEGNVLFSGRLSSAHRMLVPKSRLERMPSQNAKAYLARHRQAHGFATS